MHNYELIFFFATFPLLFLVSRVLPLLKIPKTFVLNVILLLSLVSITALVAEELNTILRIFLITSCMLSLLVKNIYQRITFYKIIRNHFILGVAALAQFDIISLQTLVILLAILPIVDMKNDSLKAMVNEVIWLFLFFAYLIISKLDIHHSFIIAEYFIVLFYFCGTIFLLNRKLDNASSILLIFTFFHLATKQLTLFPIMFQYFLILIQIVFLLYYIKNHDFDSWLKTLLVFALLIGPKDIEFNLIQVLILCLYLLLEFYDTFEFRIINNIELLLLFVIFLLVLEQVIELSNVPKISATLLFLAIGTRIVNKTKSIAHFDHS